MSTGRAQEEPRKEPPLFWAGGPHLSPPLHPTGVPQPWARAGAVPAAAGGAAARLGAAGPPVTPGCCSGRGAGLASPPWPPPWRWPCWVCCLFNDFLMMPFLYLKQGAGTLLRFHTSFFLFLFVREMNSLYLWGRCWLTARAKAWVGLLSWPQPTCGGLSQEGAFLWLGDPVAGRGGSAGHTPTSVMPRGKGKICWNRFLRGEESSIKCWFPAGLWSSLGVCRMGCLLPLARESRGRGEKGQGARLATCARSHTCGLFPAPAVTKFGPTPSGLRRLLSCLVPEMYH